MTLLCYQNKKFSQDHLDLINAANSILAGYERQGLLVSLRQLYYQFVSKNLLRNKDSEYKRLGGIIADARMAGLISWTAIEDRGRNLQGLRTQVSPAAAIKAAAREYRIDMWANQEWRPEVWVEKQALEGVIEGICDEMRVNFFATKGYNSHSEQWQAGQRFARYIQRGQRPIVFHLGDHDPSGVDMTRENQEKLSLFAGVNIIVVRVALNMNQIEQYDPPPNPAKMSDSRAPAYVEKYGYDSWELDALSPSVIRALIKAKISDVQDPVKWAERAEEEAADVRVMLDMAGE